MLTARKSAAAAILASFLVFAMQAQSQEPAPSPGEPGKPEQTHPGDTENHARANQNNTKQTPIIINILAPPKTETEASEERREREEKTKLDRGLVDLTKDVAIFTGGLFAATIALFLVTGALWWSTRRLVKGAEETAERQLRAYIYIEPFSMRHLDPSSFISFFFFAINAGKTPAYKATQSGVISIEDHPLQPNFPFPELPQTGRSRMLINPGVRPQATISAIQKFSQAEFVEIFHGHNHGKRLYIFGQASYIDAFKRERWTKFCYSLQAAFDFIPFSQAGDWKAIADWLDNPDSPPLSFEIANQHNETDEG